MKGRGLGDWMEGEKDLDSWKLWSVSGLLELDMSQRETEHSGIPMNRVKHSGQAGAQDQLDG